MSATNHPIRLGDEIETNSVWRGYVSAIDRRDDGTDIAVIWVCSGWGDARRPANVESLTLVRPGVWMLAPGPLRGR